MRVFYDCEFVEDGREIDLISIGMVREDGQEYYAVCNDFNKHRITQDEWLMKNVMSSIGWIPLKTTPENTYDMILTGPYVKSKARIRGEILDFLSDVSDVEFWANYGAYDHVALARIFGKMIDWPKKFPMFTHDLQQLKRQHGVGRLPKQADGKHNALADARHNLVIFNYIMQFADK